MAPKKTEDTAAENLPATLHHNATALELAAEVGMDFDPTESVERINLERIGISRETCQFGLLNPDGTKAFSPTVEGHIILVVTARTWWSVKFGEGEQGRPECYAVGSHTPAPDVENRQAQSCLTCKRRKINGKLFDCSDGCPPCNEKKRVLLLQDDSELPRILDIPALGIRAMDEFLVRWKATRGTPPLPLVKLKIGLKPRHSKTSDFSGTEPVITVLETVTDMERAREIKTAMDAFASIARSADTFEDDAAAEFSEDTHF